jgi:hypothetical protein
MRFGILAFFFALFLLVHGGGLLRDDIALREEVTLTMQQFERAPIVDGWVRITGAHLDLPNGIISGFSGKHADPKNGPTFVSQIFIPLRSESPKEDEQPYLPKLYIQTQDRVLVDLLERAVKHPEKLNDTQREALFRDEVRTVEGLLEPASTELKESDLAGFKLDPTAAILQNGEEPKPWYLGVIMMLGGLTMLGAIAAQLWRLFRA